MYTYIHTMVAKRSTMKGASKMIWTAGMESTQLAATLTMRM